MQYQHTQIGYLSAGATVIVGVLFLVVWIGSGFNLGLLIPTVLIVVLMANFTALTVTINASHLKIKFGFGLFQREFALREIVSAHAAKHKWYHGWGIRFWFWPRMWIYNISGFDLVELKMADGKIFRIGTDEPTKLESAIDQARKLAR